ncbi:MAG: HAD family hydrolase [Bacteroidales bacterium]|nr:HAD family hydrolase [Bacteroidales bacterium]
MIKGNFRYIFFDADDTLWQNEEYFREAEYRFAELLSAYGSKEDLINILTEKQEDNIPPFGYGSKTFMISMLDAAAEICGNGFDTRLYHGIKKIITDLAYHEFNLLDGVQETLEALSGKYILAVATKGDLVEQRTKYKESGLDRFFHHIEVLPNKSEEDYLEMARKLEIRPDEILMVGNAIKSDIAPVIAIGGTAIHIPYEVTWVHEIMEMPESDRIFEIKSIKDLPGLLL